MRRVIILDTETTGLDPSKARVIEIAFKVIDVGSGACLESFQSVVAISKEEWDMAEPAALNVNGFTWNDVQTQGRPRTDIAVTICSLFSKLKLTPHSAFFLCQNPSFDEAFFSQICPLSVRKSFNFPYYWLDFASMNWALMAKEFALKTRHPFRIPFSKDGIALSLGLPPENKPHKAMNGVDHLLLLFSKSIGFGESRRSEKTHPQTIKPGQEKHLPEVFVAIGTSRRRSSGKRTLNNRNLSAVVEPAKRRSSRNRSPPLFYKP